MVLWNLNYISRLLFRSSTFLNTLFSYSKVPSQSRDVLFFFLANIKPALLSLCSNTLESSWCCFVLWNLQYISRLVVCFNTSLNIPLLFFKRLRPPIHVVALSAFQNTDWFIRWPVCLLFFLPLIFLWVFPVSCPKIPSTKTDVFALSACRRCQPNPIWLVSALLSSFDISLNIPPLVKKAAKQDNVFSLSVCLKHESVAAWLVSLLIYLPLMILNIHLFIQKAE